MARKIRLDALLIQRGLAPDLSQAMRLILAGRVRVEGQKITTPATVVLESASIEVLQGPKYVSRGGDKLEAALREFQIQVAGKICADVGASTGGFTDCLLQHGAQRVYAIDVGRGILDWKLRQDPRVIVMENTNARQLKRLPTAVDIVTLDVSFISLKALLPNLQWWFHPGAEKPPTNEPIGIVVALIKPQYEAKRQQADRGRGVIRDALVHQQILLEVLSFAAETGYEVKGLIPSPLLGPKGNREFLAWLSYPAQGASPLLQLVEKAVR